MKNVFSRKNGKTKTIGEMMATGMGFGYYDDQKLEKERKELEEERTELEKKLEMEPKDEWIWVEGYKGTDKDMKCRGYQYEIGGAYHIDDDEEVKVCESGFHLCLNLEDVFGYYTPGEGNRYFKVKALVRKKDYEKYGKQPEPIPYKISGQTIYMPNLFAKTIDKLAAREIIFLEEVATYELYPLIRVKYEELKKATDGLIKKAVDTSIEEALNDYKIITLIEDGYSEAFANYLIKRDSSKFDKAHMLAAENLSMDVRVLTLMLG